MTKWSEVRRSKVPDAEAEAIVVASSRALRDALALDALRRERGVTQVQLAEVMAIRQSTLSAIENRQDIYLSTLREYVEGLGGHLDISAVFDDERVPLAVGG